jgi:hypothetical protein
MDVFALRERVIDEYKKYVRGFVAVKEQGVSRYVEGYFDRGSLWPEPLVQLNPSFEPGRSVDQLVRERVLHTECANIFRRRDQADTFGDPIRRTAARMSTAPRAGFRSLGPPGAGAAEPRWAVRGGG